MCGIAGFLSARPLGDTASARAQCMADSVRHRGPDDQGVWADPDGHIALAHRRLSIVDLSSAGHQPMLSREGRFVLAFNGEIYNHREIRGELEGRGHGAPWRGHSDTETLLAGIEAWGLEPTLRRAVGMFALVLWDRREHTLHLARDRFGEKPLYYGWSNGAFLFGSELKALRAWPGFSNGICRVALGQYLRQLYIAAPYSIYEGLAKLEPGCVLEVRGAPPALAPDRPLRAGDRHSSVSVRRWWSLQTQVQEASETPLCDESGALEMLNAALQEAVRLQCVADVPLGTFLSGGVDSSLVAALMQQEARQAGQSAIKTFTVGFQDRDYDESTHAKAVADHLGTEHHVLHCSEADALDAVASLPAMFDEPFADSSQIPTHLVCRAARQHVTIALSGDAGDELFGGYNRYFWGPRIWSRARHVPYGIRRAFARAAQSTSPERWNRLLAFAPVVRPGEKLHKLARAMGAGHSIEDLYASVVSEWRSAPLVAAVGAPPMPWQLGANASTFADEVLQDPAARMMYWDTQTYLPDDILCKVDRAAMSVSLETRIPFLDHRVAQIAWRLPPSMKIRNGQGKWALRQLLDRHVPRELIERPKSGFAVPVGRWLRGPLRDWAEALLDERRLSREGYLDPGPIRAVWEQHVSGQYDWAPRLWGVLVFQSWLEAQSHKR